MSSYEFYLNYVQDLEEKDRIAKLREEQDRKEKAEAEEERRWRNEELEKGVDFDGKLEDNSSIIEFSEVSDNIDDEKQNERILTGWMRDTWIKEGRPDGKEFFNRLKKYVNKSNSPIVEHWTTGKTGAGIRLRTVNATRPRTLKAIQNMVGRFKNEQE